MIARILPRRDRIWLLGFNECIVKVVLVDEENENGETVRRVVKMERVP